MNADINSAAIASCSTPLNLTFDSISSSKRRRHNPRKNRSTIQNNSLTAAVDVAVGSNSKAKYSKKPDPNAPKITPPCTECGRRFWSQKALFGHMRCHPDRQWRGINPPLNFRRPTPVSPLSPIPDSSDQESAITEEDQDVANCLILLANGGPNLIDRVSDCRFECSSCKKVFGSHQALEGHRASHKNVKGCFAIAKSDEETEDDDSLFRHCGHGRSSINLENQMSMILGTRHQCYVNFDLNMPAPVEDDDESSSSNSSGLTLDLRLGL